MNTIELSPSCQQWHTGDRTMHPPADANFLEALSVAGYLAFTGPAGLCGGKSETRSAIAIHRGRSSKWELVFRENNSDVVTTTTTDLAGATNAVLSWLQGKALVADENSVHAIAG